MTNGSVMLRTSGIDRPPTIQILVHLLPKAECLNAHWFMNLDDARRKCEIWRRDYNEERPHSAIGNKAPIELINQSAALSQP